MWLRLTDLYSSDFDIICRLSLHSVHDIDFRVRLVRETNINLQLSYLEARKAIAKASGVTNDKSSK
jgi:hypothetical protein